MNKVFKYIRYILLIILVILFSIFVYKFYIQYKPSKTGIQFTLNIVIMLIALFLLFVMNIWDLLSKKFKVINSLKYNLISIIGLIPINIVFFRILFDKTIITNVKSNIITKEFLIKEGHSFIEYNSYIIIIIIFLLILYRLINTRKSTKM